MPAAKATPRSTRPAQRPRGASASMAEHYAYVKNDLRLIAVLAAVMFLVIIVLHFYLPS
jgi:hypothetical protein